MKHLFAVIAICFLAALVGKADAAGPCCTCANLSPQTVTSNVNGKLEATAYPFNATGPATKFDTYTIPNSSNVVTLVGPNATCDSTKDIGKVFWGYGAGPNCGSDNKPCGLYAHVTACTPTGFTLDRNSSNAVTGTNTYGYWGNDDTAAIQSLCTTMATPGPGNYYAQQRGHLATGVYITSAPLTCNQGGLEGDSWEGVSLATTILCTNAVTPGNCIQITGGNATIAFRHLNILGPVNPNGNAGGQSNSNNGISFTGSFVTSDALIDHVTIGDVGNDAVYSGWTNALHVLHSALSSHYARALDCQTGQAICNNLDLEDTALFASNIAIAINNSDQPRIIGNFIGSSGVTSIDTQAAIVLSSGGSSLIRNAIIANNTLSGNFGNDILITGASSMGGQTGELQTLISNNTSMNAGRSFLYANGGIDTIVTGNQVLNPSIQTPSANQPAFFFASSATGLLSNNHVNAPAAKYNYSLQAASGSSLVQGPNWWTAGTSGTVLDASTPILPNVTRTSVIGSAPVCNALAEGASWTATDCTAACTVGGACTGGASTHCSLYCNGTGWKETGL